MRERILDPMRSTGAPRIPWTTAISDKTLRVFGGFGGYVAVGLDGVQYNVTYPIDRRRQSCQDALNGVAIEWDLKKHKPTPTKEWLETQAGNKYELKRCPMEEAL